jgi:hypothetical protein
MYEFNCNLLLSSKLKRIAIWFMYYSFMYLLLKQSHSKDNFVVVFQTYTDTFRFRKEENLALKAITNLH